MELTWINKLRIAAVATLGIVVIGILAWPLAAPADPLLPVRASDISLSGTLLLLALALAIGFAGYFIAWPHGREIGILGVPFGLAIWAGRSGPMRALTQVWNEPAERVTLEHSFRPEPLYWLVIVAAGFAGVLLAQRLRRAPASATSDEPHLPVSPEPTDGKSSTRSQNTSVYVNVLIGVVVAVLISQFFVGVFAQNIELSRRIAAQPAMGQIIFAVTGAFAVAAFVVKRYLGLSYLLPAAASIFVTTFAQAVYYRSGTIRQFAETYPAPFFPHSVFAILPVQLVALGAIGSVVGFWMAVRYDYWRKHEIA
ncbi:MAG: hypothetical protein ACM3VT_07860 [Solirubrobacterales bacterium]